MCGYTDRPAVPRRVSLAGQPTTRAAARGQHVNEVLTVARQAIWGPVPGPRLGRRGQAAPQASEVLLGRVLRRLRRPSPQDEAGMSGYEPLHCAACARIIGAYEPMIVRVGGEDRASSLAAEPELPLDGAEHLHLACAPASSPQTAEVVR
jgi:hypothetical protein